MGEEITLTKSELKEIGNDKVFREITTLRLKKIEEHQVKQNGHLAKSTDAMTKALVKINGNSTAVKYIWRVLLLFLGGLVGILFKIGMK